MIVVSMNLYVEQYSGCVGGRTAMYFGAVAYARYRQKNATKILALGRVVRGQMLTLILTPREVESDQSDGNYP